MVAEDLAKRALNWGFDRWHSVSGLIAVVIGVVSLALLIFAGVNLAGLAGWQWLTTFVAGVVVTIAWWFTHIRRVPSGLIGVGVAIVYDDLPDTKQLRADFVETLRDLISSSRLKKKLRFTEYGQSLGHRVTEDDEAAMWLSRKANLTLLIYGRARVRDAGGVKSHVLDLKWVVRHAPISQAISRKLADESGALFPKRVMMATGDLFKCEVAAQMIDVATRYVIGNAYMVSGEFEIAEDLLLDSETRLATRIQKARGTPAAVMLDKVRSTIAENYEEWARSHLIRYDTERRKESLQLAEPILDKLRTYSPDNYSARLSKAIISFVLRRDMAIAQTEIAACRGTQDATWRYSEAFLLGYQGRLDDAYKAYKGAFSSPVEDPTVPAQSEVFIQQVIEEEPDKPWLYFCVGLINFRAKEDFLAAKSDFQKFVDLADPTEFSKHIAICRTWITEIDRKLRDER